MPRIDIDLKQLIPPLSESERQMLEESLIKEGCRDPLIVWKGHDLIVDGHNRHEICERLGIPYDIVEMDFGDREDVVQWMCVNQLGRRNLTDLARADLRGTYYNSIKRAAHRPQKGDQIDHLKKKTREAVAAVDNVGPATVGRDANLAKSLDIIAEQTGIDRSEFTSGRRKVRRGDVLALAKTAEENPDAAKAAWAKVVEQSPTSGAIQAALREVRNEEAVARLSITRDELVQIHHGDFHKLAASIDDGTIDAIITDPPYPHQYLHTWSQLAEVAMRVLKPGGWCITYSGKQHLDDVIRRMTDAGLSYYWQIIFKQTLVATVHPRKVNTVYKPILMFQKPPITPPESYFMDIIQGHGIEKDGHEWQQSENGFAELIEQFTNVGDLILEPFSGAGTCPAVAKKLSRRCIAYEIDEKAYAVSCQRVFPQEGVA